MNDSLLQFWWKPSRDWQEFNLSHATGSLWASDSTAWITPSGGSTATPKSHLLLAWDDGEIRRLTDKCGNPFITMKLQSGLKKLLVIL
jgi:non-ribosomal peptide synthetase component F